MKIYTEKLTNFDNFCKSSQRKSENLFNANYPYKLLSDVSGLLISAKPQISGHKFPCSMNKANNFSRTCSELLAELEPTVSVLCIDEIRALIYLPSATGTRSSMHSENWVYNES